MYLACFCFIRARASAGLVSVKFEILRYLGNRFRAFGNRIKALGRSDIALAAYR